MRARLLRTLPLLSLLLAACSSTEGTKDTTSADGGPASSVPASSPELPTTTAAVGPTEVVSDMGVYQVLGNQGLLYSVPRLLVNGEEVDTSFLGGFEVHVTSDGKTFGLMQDSEGLNAQDTLLETVLWAFAYQDSQFGDFAHRKVDIGGYIEYLRTSGGIDPSVVFPKQLSMYATGAEPSEPIRVDLALPIVITNTGITSIESAQPQELFYIHAIKNGDIQVALGVTADGQLIYDVNEASRSGTTSPLRLIENSSGSLLTTSFGAVFADVGNITWPASPEDHLAGPYFQFLNLIMVEKVPDKFLVPDITRFSYITLEGIGDDRVFEVVHLS